MQAVQLEQLQRDMAAAMLAAKQHSGAANSLGHHKVGPWWAALSQLPSISIFVIC